MKCSASSLIAARLWLAGASVAFATAANATVWTDWSNSYTTGQTGAQATGSLGGVGVTYNGEIAGNAYAQAGCAGLCFGYPSWQPSTSFAGGAVTNAPPPGFGAIQLIGGAGTGTDTITFSAPVNDPVIAIWSLGSQPPNSDIHAQLVFDLPPTIVAGGPSSEYAGQAITLSGNTVTGFEGNGTVEFLDKGVTSITFTTPVYENWYAFTVGAAVPEPSTWALMLIGFAGVGYAGYRKTMKSRLNVTA